MIRSDENRRFLETVDDLPHTDREILRLRAFEDLDYDEISLVLGISANAARQRLSRATKRLAARLGDDAQPTPRAEKGGRRAG